MNALGTKYLPMIRAMQAKTSEQMLCESVGDPTSTQRANPFALALIDRLESPPKRIKRARAAKCSRTLQPRTAVSSCSFFSPSFVPAPSSRNADIFFSLSFVLSTPRYSSYLVTSLSITHSLHFIIASVHPPLTFHHPLHSTHAFTD